MSTALWNGPSAPTAVQGGTSQVPLSLQAGSSGVVMSGNTFQIQETGLYRLNITVPLGGAQQAIPFVIEVFNVTNNAREQAFEGTLSTPYIPLTFTFGFNVLNNAAFYAIRLIVPTTPGITGCFIGPGLAGQLVVASSGESDSGILRTATGTNFFAAAGTSAYQLAVTADPFPRLEVFASGQMQWGSGAAAADITLTRNAANSLLLTTTGSPTNGQFTFRERGGPGTTTLFTAFLPHTGDVTNQPFHIGMENFTNVVGPRENPTVAMGFNFTPGGVVVAGQPGIGMRIEEAFESPAATFMAELHLEYMTSAGVGLRAFSCAANRATDVLSISSRGDSYSFNRRSDGAQIYNMNLTNGVFSLVLSGSTFQKDTNNQAWITQLNAAASAHRDLIRLNAQDIVALAADGNSNGVLSALNFAVGGSGNDLTFLWRGGTNTLSLINGVAPGAGSTNVTMLTALDRGGLAGASALHVRAGNAAVAVIGDISNFARGANVVAAASITPTGNTFHVTGNTNIDTITVANINDGTIISIVFDGTPTVGDGTGNLVLAGNLVATANDMLTLMKDGASWIEVARSVN